MITQDIKQIYSTINFAINPVIPVYCIKSLILRIITKYRVTGGLYGLAEYNRRNDFVFFVQSCAAVYNCIFFI